MARPKISAETRQFNEALGRRIAGARMASGMKAKDLAKAAGISKQSLSDYESGDATCAPIVIRRLAEALGISTGALIPRFAGAFKPTPVAASPSMTDIS